MKTIKRPITGKGQAHLLSLALALAMSSFPAAAQSNYLKPEPEWLQKANLIDAENQLTLDINKQSSRPASSWAFAFDNDLLVPGHRDQDYTYGLNFTQIGDKVDRAKVTLNAPLKAIDEFIGFTHSSLSTQETFSREIGAFGFTPEDITINEPNPNDRPYASLVYISSSREQVDLVENVAWKSSLTLGTLGLGLVGELQNVVHQGTSSKAAKGWDNQISEGGEFTGRYVLARQKYFDSSSDNVEIKSTIQASAGYLTEASWSWNLRAGKIHSPWASFNPELSNYGEKSSYSSTAKPISEHFFWTGFALKARAYNAFIQGQFRDSEVTYDRDQLNSFLVEAWAGYTISFKEGYRISYVLRGHSSEINEGAGDRNLLWGGIIITRSI